MNNPLVIILKATIYFNSTYKLVKLKRPVITYEDKIKTFKASEIRKINYIWGIDIKHIDLYFIILTNN